MHSDGLDKNPIVFRGHKDYVKSVDMSHDGQYILTCANDKLCKLWNIKKPSILQLELPANIVQNDAKSSYSIAILNAKEVSANFI